MSTQAHPATLVEALEGLAAITDRGFTFIGYDGKETSLTFAELHDVVGRLGGWLRDLGVRPGDRIALVLPEAAEFVPAFLAAVHAGAVPVPCYPPVAFGRLPDYVDHLAGILAIAEPVMVWTVPALELPFAGLRSRVASLRHVTSLPPDKDLVSDEPVPAAVVAAPADPVFLQFTSGSTARPKGVVVTHGSLAANTRAIMRDAVQVRPDDSGISWLPLYHDMGLIGFVLAPIFVPTPVTFLPTLSFLSRPAMWFEEIHARRATVTFGPNFAFGLATRRIRPEMRAQWDLSCVRVLGCGAEPINPDTIQRFLSEFGTYGLRPEAFLPCYGMAEATLAMAFPREGESMRLDEVGGRSFVSCGQAVPGHELAVLDDEGRPIPDGQTGEIAFRGPSVAAGYYRDPEATARSFRDGWLLTGDLGYLESGRVFVTGRKKDLLIIRGRNTDPQRVEWVVEQLPDVREGNVVAFTRPGSDTEELVVVLERRGQADQEAVADAVRRRVAEALHLSVADVVTLDRGSLPKTSSGKVRRQFVRSLYLDDDLRRAG